MNTSIGSYHTQLIFCFFFLSLSGSSVAAALMVTTRNNTTLFYVFISLCFFLQTNKFISLVFISFSNRPQALVVCWISPNTIESQ